MARTPRPTAWSARTAWSRSSVPSSRRISTPCSPSKIERDYSIQIQWQLACTGRDWCDYVSWNPDFPGPMQLWVQPVERDPAHDRELQGHVRKFLIELELKFAELKRRYDWQEAA